MFNPKVFSPRLLWDLTMNDFKSRYIDSLFGSLWAFVMPLVSLLVIFMAMSLGVRMTSTEDVPYLFYLACGLLPWSFYSESLLSSMSSIIDKSYLVKKIIFDVEILPLARAASHLPILLFFNAILLAIALFYRIEPKLAWLQLVYFDFALFSLVCAFAWLTSSLVVFVRDLRNIIAIVLQAGFWLTPVIWSAHQLPEKFRFLLYFNPMAYIISGLRDTMVGTSWFWERPRELLIFWVTVFLFYKVGRLTFTHLKTHFADVI